MNDGSSRPALSLLGTTTLDSPIVISVQSHLARVSRPNKSSQPLDAKKASNSLTKAMGGVEVVRVLEYYLVESMISEPKVTNSPFSQNRQFHRYHPRLPRHPSRGRDSIAESSDFVDGLGWHFMACSIDFGDGFVGMESVVSMLEVETVFVLNIMF